MNPPFMRYKRLDTDARERYAEQFQTATGQFGLHAPFVEQALECLKPGGWLTTFLPVNTLYGGRYERLRSLIRTHSSDPIELLPEETFDATVTAVLITLKKRPGAAPDGNVYLLHLRGWVLEDILEGVGVDDVDQARSEYSDLHEWYKRRVDIQDRKERGVEIVRNDDGRVVRITETATPERQAGLEEWSQ